MNILFLTNNSVPNQLIDWLRKCEGISLSVYNNKLSLQNLIDDRIDLIISYNYRHIINKEIVQNFVGKIINLHISFLPWNKGAHPNVWSFLEDTPKGVTIHLIDEGLDTGDILFQKEIFFDERNETLKSSYELLHREIQKLFIKNWGKIKNFTFVPAKQIGTGSIHNVKDFENIEFIIEDEGWDILIHTFKENYRKFISN